jgi:hypothetical protein
MIITTEHGTIKSDKEGFLLKNGDIIGGEIRLGDWDSEENYTEVPKEECYAE